jgi:ComF family protein
LHGRKRNHMKQQLSTIKQTFFDHFIPLSCLLCRQHCPHPIALCNACIGLINANNVEESNVSLECRDQTWEQFRYLSTYQTPLKELIQTGKFNDNLAVFKTLGQLFAQQILLEGYDPDLVMIPVPLHSSRLLERGYNQANEIALPLARTLDLTINNHIVIRSQAAKTQHLLSKQQRVSNADQLFEVKATVPKKVAIVDDVFTTGATISSISSCLKNAGVEIIEVWIIARTLKAS